MVGNQTALPHAWRARSAGLNMGVEQLVCVCGPKSGRCLICCGVPGAGPVWGPCTGPGATPWLSCTYVATMSRVVCLACVRRAMAPAGARAVCVCVVTGGAVVQGCAGAVGPLLRPRQARRGPHRPCSRRFFIVHLTWRKERRRGCCHAFVWFAVDVVGAVWRAWLHGHGTGRHLGPPFWGAGAAAGCPGAQGLCCPSVAAPRFCSTLLSL